MYMEAGLMGEDIAKDAVGNTANVNKIANTDNVFFSEKMRTLFIGEDSGTHVNNYVWAYNVDTKKLTRIMSAVAGAENTGLQVIDNLQGKGAYIMGNTQHWGEVIGSVPADLKAQLVAKIGNGRQSGWLWLHRRPARVQVSWLLIAKFDQGRAQARPFFLDRRMCDANEYPFFLLAALAIAGLGAPCSLAAMARVMPLPTTARRQ
jgi:hypothetical protein